MLACCWASPVSGGELHRHRGTAGAPSDCLSTGAGRLAVAYGLSARLLHRTLRRGGGAPRPSGAGKLIEFNSSEMLTSVPFSAL